MRPSMRFFVLLAVFCVEHPSSTAAPLSAPVVVGYEVAQRLKGASPSLPGEVLLSELNCRLCHLSSPVGGKRLDAVAQVASKGAPRLRNVGDRLRVSFLTEFLADPSSVRPGTTMPDVLHALSPQERSQAVRALVHYLRSLLTRQGPPRPLSPGDSTRGKQLFHTVGCVACHAPDDSYPTPGVADGVEAPGISIASVPLGDLHSKYQVSGLDRFLSDPLSVRPGGRMPRIVLNESERRDLVSYLLGASPVEEDRVEPIDSELAARGRELFRELRCSACHGVPERGAAEQHNVGPRGPPFEQIRGRLRDGCLSNHPPAAAVRYGLSTQQREAIGIAFSRPERPSLSDDELLRRQFLAFNCYGCHGYAGEGGPEPGRSLYFGSRDEDLGDEGRFPPALDQVGRKLQRAALSAILRGRGGIRPYVLVRMPDFGGQASIVEKTLRSATQGEDRWPQEIMGRNRFGRLLVGERGTRCISCHDFVGHRSLGIRAFDLAAVTTRLRPEWFREYLMAPNDFRPGTRMPSFWPDGQSAFKDVLSGDSLRQIDAIWVYLLEAEQTRLPEGLERGDVFELIPRDRTIIQRTFMSGVGQHAIAVGFPERYHLSVDADLMRLATVWKGRFLDAENTWDNRFVPPSEPLGEEVIMFPAVHPFAALPRPGAPWPDPSEDRVKWRFDGYSLNNEGYPTFLYRWKSVKVRETFMPLPSGRGLRRALQLEGAEENLSHLAARGDTIEPVVGSGFEIGRRLRVSFGSIRRAQPLIRHVAGNEELIVPIRWRDGKADISVDLEW